jgi:hypothetical protein
MSNRFFWDALTQGQSAMRFEEPLTDIEVHRMIKPQSLHRRYMRRLYDRGSQGGGLRATMEHVNIYFQAKAHILL